MAQYMLDSKMVLIPSVQGTISNIESFEVSENYFYLNPFGTGNNFKLNMAKDRIKHRMS